MKRPSEYKAMKALRESRDNEGRTAVYVGTYGKYNDGSLGGKWMCLGDYDDVDEFYDACRELHSDEEDPEIMIQDCDYLPDSLYSEYGVSQEAIDFAHWVDDGGDYDAAEAYIDLYGEWDERKFEDRYIGEFNSDRDMCWEFINSCGGIAEAMDRPENYFDYEHFGHELKWDMSEDDEWQKEILEMDDYDAGERYIEEIYGDVENMAKEDPEMIERYFDIDAYARDVMIGDVCKENGYYFWNE